MNIETPYKPHNVTPERWMLFLIAILGIVGSIFIIIYNSSKDNTHYRETKPTIRVHQVTAHSVTPDDENIEVQVQELFSETLKSDEDSFNF